MIQGFTGINTHTSPTLIGKGELAFMKNYSSKKVGTLIKAGDYEIENAQITSSQDILGGIDFFRNSGTHTHVVACDGASNSDIYLDVAGTWTAQSQSLTAGSRIRFAYSPTLDTLFAVNYDDTTISYNGSSWSTSTNVTNAAKGEVVMAWGDRIYIFNCYVGATAYPTRAYRSSTVDSGSITWDATDGWITFDDVIVGAGKVGENLLVVCENSAHIFTLGESKYRISSIGGVSHESIVSYDDYAFYAALSGFYATNGSVPQKVSLPIQEIWENIPYANFAKMRAEVLDDYIYVYLGDLTFPEIINNCLAVYDINQNDWTLVELVDDVQELHTYVTSTGRKLFMGNDDGEVFKMFSSDAQNTEVFTSALETDWVFGSGERKLDDYHELWLYGDKFSSISAFIKIDGKNTRWIPIGDFSGSINVIKFKHRGFRAKFRLQETSKGDMHEIHGIEYGYNPSSEKDRDEIT